MRFTVVYLARLREALGRGSEQIELPESSTLAVLVAALRERGGPWATELAAGRAVRFAINQEMTDAASPLADGDEVALFPPVTGG